MAEDILIWPSILKQSDFPSVCPLKKGTYKMDFTPDLSTLPRNFNGRYKAEFQMHYKGERAENCTFYYDIQRYLMGWKQQ